MRQKSILLGIENLRKSFGVDRTGALKLAVNDVSLDIIEGECLALIGESGSGKSSFGKCLLRLIEPDSGSVWHDGSDLMSLPERHFRRFRRDFQMVFQNPIEALNPRQTVASILLESLRVHHRFGKRDGLQRARELLAAVKLETEMLNRLPHELSGGQRQRVALARALSPSPRLLIADEPTSSLDAPLQRKIIALLQEMQREFKLTVLLISHDLSVVHDVADRIAVMYRGKIVEIAPAQDLLLAPKHPYTKGLLHSTLGSVSAGDGGLFDTHQQTHGKAQPSQGCPYAADCPVAETICLESEPVLAMAGPRHHQTACHLVAEVIPMSRLNHVRTWSD
ncbi:MAG: ABC transporter ATP-binding protein [bacterium]